MVQSICSVTGFWWETKKKPIAVYEVWQTKVQSVHLLQLRQKKNRNSRTFFFYKNGSFWQELNVNRADLQFNVTLRLLEVICFRWKISYDDSISQILNADNLVFISSLIGHSLKTDSGSFWLLIRKLFQICLSNAQKNVTLMKVLNPILIRHLWVTFRWKLLQLEPVGKNRLLF